MHLYVMRHGPAEDAASTGRDADRSLTDAGRERVRRVAAELHRVRDGAPLPRVLTSPLLRARQTAELVAAVCGAPAPEACEALSISADPAVELAAELARAGRDALLVGHQPNAEQLVRTLVATTAVAPGAARDLLPGGVCTAYLVALEPEPTAKGVIRWHLRRILDPRALA